MTNPGDMPLSYQILPAVDAAKVEDGGSLDLGDEVGKLQHQILRNVNITFSVCFENMFTTWAHHLFLDKPKWNISTKYRTFFERIG